MFVFFTKKLNDVQIGILMVSTIHALKENRTGRLYTQGNYIKKQNKTKNPKKQKKKPSSSHALLNTEPQFFFCQKKPPLLERQSNICAGGTDVPSNVYCQD